MAGPRIEIQTDEPLVSLPDDMVGNVYQVRGGRGAQLGHMHVIISAYEYGDRCCSHSGFAVLTVNRDGQIIGNYIDDSLSS